MRNRKEQEEAVRRLNRYIRYIKSCGNTQSKHFKAVVIVLKMLKEKDAEIKKYKQLYYILSRQKARTEHDNMEKDRIIDLYIDELVSNEFDRCCQECCRECEKDKDTLRTCIKQYFERKVEDERNKI